LSLGSDLFGYFVLNLPSIRSTGAHLEVSLKPYPWVNICNNNMQQNY
jgi:hypothetical protein